MKKLKALLSACAMGTLLSCHSAESGDDGSEERMRNGLAVIVTGLA
jgi:hypothetical protein